MDNKVQEIKDLEQRLTNIKLTKELEKRKSNPNWGHIAGCNEGIDRLESQLTKLNL